jgi:hypothetical protein
MRIGRRELLTGGLLAALGVVAVSVGRGAAAARPTLTVYKSPT